MNTAYQTLKSNVNFNKENRKDILIFKLLVYFLKLSTLQNPVFKLKVTKISISDLCGFGEMQIDTKIFRFFCSRTSISI